MMAAPFDDTFVADLLPAFVEEANEQVSAFEQLLLQLEDAPTDHELLDALFRCAHTVKGSAGLFGLDALVGFTHHVETVLDLLREGRLQLSPALSTVLLKSNDAIRDLVANATGHNAAALGAGSDEAARQRSALVAELQAASGHGARAPGSSAVPPADAASTAVLRRCQATVRFGCETFRDGMDPLSMMAYLEQMDRCEDVVCDRDAVPGLDVIDPEACHLRLRFALHSAQPRADLESAFQFVMDSLELAIDDPVAGAAPDDGPAPEDPLVSDDPATPTAAAPATPRRREAAAADEGGYIRVHAHRLDEVINLLGELVVAGAGASLLARQTRQRGLIEANQQITRLIEGIRNSTLKLRMVPIGDTFARFRRVVRDTAAELGKDIALDIVGGDTELDKAVVERIADPLMHLVRNAMDHGLETPAHRQEAGKPAQGRLTLSACHESGSILIRISDDGRGIQREKVLQRAWQRGLLAPGVRPESDDEIHRLIFEPGFSTAETVTNLSGRGVGMDVVRSNIEALRGSVTIDSVEGQGSRIEIRLPLTLAIIDGFLVGVGASRFIFPLESVVEVIDSRAAASAADTQGRGCVDLRGRLLPVIDLRQLYALDSPAPERGSVVVVRCGARRFGVRVDGLLGQHQTVIKPLGRLLRGLRGISGSSILGTGEVALIVDVDTLGQLASAPPAGARPASPPPRAPSHPSPPSSATAAAPSADRHSLEGAR